MCLCVYTRPRPWSPSSLSHLQAVCLLADVVVKLLCVFAVLGQLGRHVQVLVLQLIVQRLHIKLLQIHTHTLTA